MSTLVGTHNTPSRSFGSVTQKIEGIGWLSHSTYVGLPPRFQRAARELASKGELVIEDMPIVTEGA